MLSRLTLFCILLSMILPLTVLANGQTPIGNLESTTVVAGNTSEIEVVGWAIDKDGINKLNVYLDDQFVGNTQYGHSRPDVKKAYPDIVDSDKSGFSYTINKIPAGNHVLRIEIISNSGVTLNLKKDLTVKPVILSNLEYPSNKQDILSGVTNYDVQGWIISPDVKNVAVFVDSEWQGNAEWGLERPDVYKEYKHLENSLNSGFLFHLDVSNLKRGTHQVAVYTIDSASQLKLIGKSTLINKSHYSFLVGITLLFILFVFAFTKRTVEKKGLNMLFNSVEFIFIFLPITFILYYALAHIKYTRLALYVLILMSLIYYSYWYPINLLVLLFSILFNYAFGTLLNRNPSKFILTFGISFNLLLLGYFKYYNFFIHNINSFTHLSLQALSITLPIGISFYTFQKVGYLVDSYKQKTSNYKFSSYLLFVVFFPQLIAGPIVHHSKLVPQFSNQSIFKFNYENITKGIFLFTIGLSKKLLLADTLAPLANNVFDKAEGLTLLEAWGGALSYTLQLYFDFSGYSDMAIGLALIFNIKLPINFDSPYKSSNIIDFWRRWHITLSSFLRDYLYISLGGSRKGKLRKYLNLFITMVLGGIWHGAGWTYVIWGILHGLYLLINHVFRDAGFKMSKIPAKIITLFFIVLAWIFFRANNLADAKKVLSGFLGLNGVKFNDLTYLNKEGAILIIIASIIVLLPNSNQMLDKFKPNFRWFVFFIVLMILSLYYLNNPSQFLYFQF